MILALTGFWLVVVSLIVFILIIGLIIVIHEFGHFLVARKAGILCYEFSIGMGPCVYKKQFKNTLFCLRAIPIGGYVQMADDETRFVSSSGGAFTLISNYILEKGGYVCGAAFVGQNVKHIIIDKKEDMYKLRGSKYVQSDTNTVYSQIKDLLNRDKFVLFTGTPCQVAGLNSYLGKDYDNLLTMDLICHGIPSPLVWEKYLKALAKGRTVNNVTFRNKKYGC